MKRVYLFLLVLVLISFPIYFYNSSKLEKEYSMYVDQVPKSDALKSVFQVDNVNVDIHPVTIWSRVASYIIHNYEGEGIEINFDNFIYNSEMELILTNQSPNSKYIKYFLNEEKNLFYSIKNEYDLIKIYFNDNLGLVTVTGKHIENSYDIYYVSKLNIEIDSLSQDQINKIITNINLYFSLYKDNCQINRSNSSV